MSDPTAYQSWPEPGGQRQAAPQHAGRQDGGPQPAAAQQQAAPQPTAAQHAPFAATGGPQPGFGQVDPGSGRRPARRWLGIQPVLLVGIVLLTLVTLLTIVLIFTGDIGAQAPRVVWTIIALVGFTGLLALDLALARRSALPLIIGVIANVYLLAVLMLATWVEPVVVTPPATECDPVDGCDYVDDDPYGPPLIIVLFGVYLLAFFVVRAAAAGAWALIALGRRGGVAFARVIGLVAAALVGLAGVMLTLHLAIEAFGVRVGDTYWRIAVAVVVLAALGACITALLFWNRRQLDRTAPRPAPPVGVGPGGPSAQQHPAGAYPAPQPPTAPRPTGPYPPASSATDPHSAGPYRAGTYPPGTYPAGPYPAGPYPPGPYPPGPSSAGQVPNPAAAPPPQAPRDPSQPPSWGAPLP